MRWLFFATIFIISSIAYIALAQTGFKDDKRILIYIPGNSIKLNKKQKMYTIEKIEYQTTRCFGTCPQFNIVIEKSKNATFDAQNDNRLNKDKPEIKGKYKAIIKDINYDEIINLLNEIDFPNLKDNYTIGRKDYQTCFLTITYDNGKLKKIRDLGLSGTPELKKLYELMFWLRFNQEWEKQ